jgi:hypothetical protein
MKGFILALVTMATVIGSVFANSFVLDRIIGEMTKEVESFEFHEGSKEEEEKFIELYKSYKSAERYISITVNHDDLTNIDNDFNEIIGCLKVNDIQGATIAKSRLEGCFSHLWRLSSINIDSII